MKYEINHDNKFHSYTLGARNEIYGNHCYLVCFCTLGIVTPKGYFCFGNPKGEVRGIAIARNIT